MFKRLPLSICTGLLFLFGCTKKDAEGPASVPMSRRSSASYQPYAMRGADDPFSVSIPVDSANRMIQSYLYSINYPANDSGLRSLSFNADTLRAYLSNNNIKHVRFMLAHQAEYMNNGHFGQFAGMSPAALTFVIVGVNEDGVCIKNQANEVYEHMRPCPFFCEPSATEYIY